MYVWYIAGVTYDLLASHYYEDNNCYSICTQSCIVHMHTLRLLHFTCTHMYQHATCRVLSSVGGMQAGCSSPQTTQLLQTAQLLPQNFCQ